MTQILERIQKLFAENDKMAALLEPTNDFPYEHLLVDCVDEKEEIGDILYITAQTQDLRSINISNKRQDIDTCYLIQFQFKIPLEIPPENFNQVTSTLHFFNHLLHCPGFELDEISDHLIYRYVWFTNKNGLDTSILMVIVQNIQLCFKMFLPYIKDIANGQYTLEDILKQVIQISNQI